MAKLKTLSFAIADALAAPTPEEEKARERAEARKRRNNKHDPEEGKAGKTGRNPTYTLNCDAIIIIGRELISLVAATIREIGKRNVEAPTKADETMLLPLAQTMSKVSDRRASEQVRTELVEGLGTTSGYGFDMARKESTESWLIRVLYHMPYYDKQFQAQPGVMVLLEAHG